MKYIKLFYNIFKVLFQRLNLVVTVNWFKTIYFNFKKFPIKIALKLPVFFYGRVKFHEISGKISINGNIKRGMISFGQRFEVAKKSKGTAEFTLLGKLVFNGYMHMGKDIVFYIGKNAYCELGYMSCLGSDVKLICTEKIIIGDWTGIGFESQIIDTNSHPMKNTITGELYPISNPIILGSYNAFSNRISIMPNAKTPDYCVIASNTLCNKDYTPLGSNILIGGIPAKLIKNNYSRDWDNDKVVLKKYKIINWG